MSEWVLSAGSSEACRSRAPSGIYFCQAYIYIRTPKTWPLALCQYLHGWSNLQPVIRCKGLKITSPVLSAFCPASIFLFGTGDFPLNQSLRCGLLACLIVRSRDLLLDQEHLSRSPGCSQLNGAIFLSGAIAELGRRTSQQRFRSTFLQCHHL